MHPIRFAARAIAAITTITPLIFFMCDSNMQAADSQQLRVNTYGKYTIGGIDPFRISFDREDIYAFFNFLKGIFYTIAPISVCIVHKGCRHNELGNSAFGIFYIGNGFVKLKTSAVLGGLHFKTYNAKQKVIMIAVTLFLDNDIFLNSVTFNRVIQIHVAFRICIDGSA